MTIRQEIAREGIISWARSVVAVGRFGRRAKDRHLRLVEAVIALQKADAEAADDAHIAAIARDTMHELIQARGNEAKSTKA